MSPETQQSVLNVLLIAVYAIVCFGVVYTAIAATTPKKTTTYLVSQYDTKGNLNQVLVIREPGVTFTPRGKTVVEVVP